MPDPDPRAVKAAARALARLQAPDRDPDEIVSGATPDREVPFWGLFVTRVTVALAAAEAASPAPGGWRPTHRHVKRGTDYQIVGWGILQAQQPPGDEEPLVIYRDLAGKLWARPSAEFHDGRFEVLPTPPSTDPSPPVHDAGAAEALLEYGAADTETTVQLTLRQLTAAGWALRRVRP